MEPINGPAITFGVRITFKHINSEVLAYGWLTVCMLIAPGLWFLAPSPYDQGLFPARYRRLPAAEEVDNYLIVLLVEAKAILGFEIEGVFLHVCEHKKSSPAGVICLSG